MSTSDEICKTVENVRGLQERDQRSQMAGTDANTFGIPFFDWPGT